MTMKHIHSIEHVPERHSFVVHRRIPAHERHSITRGPVTAHGAASLEAARRLMDLHVHCVRNNYK